MRRDSSGQSGSCQPHRRGTVKARRKAKEKEKQTNLEEPGQDLVVVVVAAWLDLLAFKANLV